MNIFIVPIEPIDLRYTKQWYDNIPKLIKNAAKGMGLNVGVLSIDGNSNSGDTSNGAFLNFAETNKWKAEQIVKITELFMDGAINNGDRFLITDAWNFLITPIKYMSELLDIPVEIHGIWHAGHYDPSDILGMKMSNEWPGHIEKSWYYSCDYNYFGTNYHKNMFLNNLQIPESDHNRAVRSGQPHDYIVPILEPYGNLDKRKQIIWPHRYNQDKQPEIAEDLSNTFTTIITQKRPLSKMEYYNELGSSQIIFSCSLHENLGISVMEGVISGVIPVLPDRCSYSEMYNPVFLYPSEWTESFESYMDHRDELCNFINERLENSEKYQTELVDQKNRLIEEYLSSSIMINNLIR